MHIIPWRNKGKDEDAGDGGAQFASWPDVDRMVERFFNEPWGLLRSGADTGWRPAASFLPSLDVTESDEELVVRAELPGLEVADIDIQVVEDVLTLTGEKKERHEERSGHRFLSERSFGRFRRSVQLPSRIDADKARAAYEQGVLTVRLPRSAESRPRRIEVRAGG